jgi:hypothetical protein
MMREVVDNFYAEGFYLPRYNAFWCSVARMSELELEQRMNNEFIVKLGKRGSEIREILV